jgi:hypothetical protein
MKKRAESRRTWVVHICRVEDQPRDDLSHQTTPDERLAMMWPLAVEAWRLSGRPIPVYNRASSPVKVLTNAVEGGKRT